MGDVHPEKLTSTNKMAEEFEKATEAVRNIKTASNEDLLELYALFKQATVGDCSTGRPGILDQKGRAKWDAWKAKEGTNADDAKAKYVEKAKAMGASWLTHEVPTPDAS